MFRTARMLIEFSPVRLNLDFIGRLRPACGDLRPLISINQLAPIDCLRRRAK
jgi:hypothetical protein